MYTYTLTPTGYLIAADGVPVIDQHFKPGVSGCQPMTPEEAIGYAEALIAELTAPAPDPLPSPEA